MSHPTLMLTSSISAAKRIQVHLSRTGCDRAALWRRWLLTAPRAACGCRQGARFLRPIRWTDRQEHGVVITARGHWATGCANRLR